MTYALLGLVAVLVASNITSAIWLHSATNGRDTASDTAAEWRLRFEQKQHELELSDLNVKTLTSELDETKKLLEVTQRQRNEAMETARDHFVQRIKSAGTADAASLLASLLAQPITGPDGGVLPKANRSDDAKDGLLDPEA